MKVIYYYNVIYYYKVLIFLHVLINRAAWSHKLSTTMTPPPLHHVQCCSVRDFVCFFLGGGAGVGGGGGGAGEGELFAILVCLLKDFILEHDKPMFIFQFLNTSF